MYTEGHPRLERLTTELREQSRHSGINQGIRLRVIERDSDQCQNYHQTVSGRNSFLDRKNPAKSETRTTST